MSKKFESILIKNVYRDSSKINSYVHVGPLNTHSSFHYLYRRRFSPALKTIMHQNFIEINSTSIYWKSYKMYKVCANLKAIVWNEVENKNSLPIILLCSIKKYVMEFTEDVLQVSKYFWIFWSSYFLVLGNPLYIIQGSSYSCFLSLEFAI